MINELLCSRRSIRKYEARGIEKEKIDSILQCALMAPSSRGIRPWEFISVDDKGTLQKLSLCKQHGASFLAGAPLGIVIAADPEKCDVWTEDASIAAVIIQLAAQSLGLGSCWIQVRNRFHPDGLPAEEYIKQVLGMPSGLKVECIISIGYPAEEKNSIEKNGLLCNKIHINKY
ncbi:MAG TPA: nitroreductase family protein [Clostridia bacterium]|nr:nitroreductase family protein [Clostridia bacterium]